MCIRDRVSIIVPVYNAEKSLARCVDSILNQEFRDFELILMDDGRTVSYTHLRWAVSPIGRGSIKYLWLECAEALTKTANVQV